MRSGFGDFDEANYSTMDMHDHFSFIAPQYHILRTTDSEPITYMIQKLTVLPSIKAVDVGCGVGRYDQILCRELGDKFMLTCIDSNAGMLEALNRNLAKEDIQNFTSIQSNAEDLPIPSNSYDCVFTLNAIHHFDLIKFLQQSARVLRIGGYLFIYTRLRDQNKRNIWGQFFPSFHQKETRLYTLSKVSKAVGSIPGIRIQSIEYFKYERLSSLPELEKKVRSHHYSTFFLYTANELEKAILKFNEKINEVYEDVNRVFWHDENILFVIRKEK